MQRLDHVCALLWVNRLAVQQVDSTRIARASFEKDFSTGFQMIQKSLQQDTDRAGDRLLRQTLEPLGWVLTGIEEDFGIDHVVQIFADGSPDGLWFKIQLKSSASSRYSADGRFVSVELDLDHAKHYALELRDPVFLIHADIQAGRVFWSAPQLDNVLIRTLKEGNNSSTVTIRIPTSNTIPDATGKLLETVEKLYIVLGNRTLVATSASSFAESLQYQPGEGKFREEFQRKNDILKLRRVQELLVAKHYSEARSRARVVVSDPDSSIENRFWAEDKIGTIDWAEAVTRNAPQAELPSIWLSSAQKLQLLTKKGPSHLKLFALIARKAAELDQLVIENWGLTILLHQHRTPAGNPLMGIKVYVDHAFSTMRVIAKYNQCLRLAKYASNFNGRWILPGALIKIVHAAASFVARIGRLRETGMEGAATEFQSSILQICKLAAWIAEESGDQEAIALAISAALLGVNSQETDAYQWALRTLDQIADSGVRGKAVELIERHLLRWKGEKLEGDSYRGDPVKQLIENAAASLGIDLSNESDPLVRGLQIAARDNSPERVLRTCEHMVVSLGAIGPTARRIQMLFGTQMAASKVLHCALHDYHLEARDLDSGLTEFKSKYCDSCPDRAPRPVDWKFSGANQQQFLAKYKEFVGKFNASGAGFRFTPSD